MIQTDSLDWALLVRHIQPDTSHQHSSAATGSEVTDRGSECKCGVILPDFQKEALSLTQGLGEGSMCITELRLQHLSLQWQDYWIGYSEQMHTVLWLGAAHHVSWYQILIDSNRCDYNTTTQPGALFGHISTLFILKSNRTPVSAVFKIHRVGYFNLAEVRISWPDQ